ncbi:nucleoside hydrolase [Sphingobium aquiterrae]|uniref:nucleoside hydrolase n=1 Tax=Sphingobium aquiterrae TaxID=2038656 RepID=UPI003016F980
MKVASILFATLLLSTVATPAPAATKPATPKQLVIVDNDFGVPVSGIQAVPAITDPSVEVLGITTLFGDSYVPDDTTHLLRFLEIIGRADIPVHAGADRPLVRSKSELLAWERLHGIFPWKGAWNEPQPGHAAVGPNDIQPMVAGETKLKAAPGHAVAFLIDQVRKHPGQVSIVAAGPLTNLALAQRLDPTFAANVKRLVIMGGLVDNNLKQVTDDANFYNDFNFKADPEAADIVMTSDFPSITIVGNVTNKTRLTPELLARITAVKTPLSDYYAKYSLKGLPLWDELAAAIFVDPTLITRSTKAYMRVDTDHGMNYGTAHVWPEATRPHQGEHLVEIVEDIDPVRFKDMMINALQSR